MNKKALIVIDYQKDFADPKGSLYIPNAETLAPKIKQLITQFKAKNHLVIATKDFHPENHISFEIWPPHCIQNTPGAEFYELSEDDFDKIILKGTRQKSDSYSAFFDEDETSNGLHRFLQKQKIKQIVIIGLAQDVCVSATLKDAIKLGYHGYIDLNYCAGLANIISF